MSAAGTTLSRFTPSLMSRELLERLFVARERTLDAIMKRVDAAATSDERNHTLLVGPRGAGKTHLVSLVYHRVNQRRGEGARLQISWLPEDPWTIASYRHLLAQIAERLEPDRDEAVPATVDHLESFLVNRARAGGPIVVVVENLDQILSSIGPKGQQQLRHVLQTDRALLLVATSTGLDRALSDQASPFYGFFTTTRLEPFDVDQAAAMLTRIARERDDQKLVDYLGSDEGRARLRTIAHLAGGQPRMWAALASALTVEGLDDLIDLLLTRFDDLTPYYQEQLGRLSPQQRLVVAELAELDRPVNVKELAERLDVDQRSLGKTMVDLVDRGWAAPTTSPIVAELIDKRRTYYELAEPLARLSFQIKESRGEPLRLIVEFLKHWFDPRELSSASTRDPAAGYLVLANHGHEHDPVVAVARRLHRLPATRAPAVELLGEIDDALAALRHRDPEPFLRLPMPVRAALEERIDSGDRVEQVRLEIHDAADTEFGHTRHPAMESWVARAEEMARSTSDVFAGMGQLVLADWLGRAWRFDEALAVVSAVEHVRGPQDPATLVIRISIVQSYLSAGRARDAVALAEAVVRDATRTLGAEDLVSLSARASLGHAYWLDGRFEEASGLFEAVHAALERLMGPDHPDTLNALGNLAGAYWHADRVPEAISLAQDVVDRFERTLGSEDERTLDARNNLALVYQEAGRTAEAVDVAESVVAARERSHRHDEPSLLVARGNLALFYEQAGRVEEAIVLAEAVLADRLRVLGADHPDTLGSQTNLAIAYARARRWDGAVPLAEAAIEGYQRSLGPAHPTTIGARGNLAGILRASGQIEEARRLEHTGADDQRS